MERISMSVKELEKLRFLNLF